MSLNLSKRERKELQATNIGLQLLFDNRQARSSATIFLQWCVAKPVADYFRDNSIRNALLFVQVINPGGHEVRHVFDLTSPQEVVQFHAPGTHTIRANIVWNVKRKTARNLLLEKNRGRYSYSLCHLVGERNDTRKWAVGMKIFGAAELPIEVPAAFFAPQLSAWEIWWINLGFPSIAQNSCSIRRRRIIAYVPIFKPLVVLIWVVLMGLFRLVGAFVFNVLLALRTDWTPIVHPFSQSFTDICIDKDNNTSWLYKRADGKERAWGDAALLFTPLIHVILSLVSLWILAGNDFKLTWANFGIAYVATIAGIIVLLLAIVLVGTVFSNIGKWWEKGWENLKAWLMPDKWEQLLCSTTPAQGLRPIGYTPRLLYQRVVGAYCKPVVT